jgi:hypothetical protein
MRRRIPLVAAAAAASLIAAVLMPVLGPAQAASADLDHVVTVLPGDVPLDGSATASPEWDRLPGNAVGDVAEFQVRWAPDHLTLFVRVDDAVADEEDGVEISLGGATRWRFWTDGIGDVPGEVAMRVGGYTMAMHLSRDDLAPGDSLDFDLRVIDDGEIVAAWNPPGGFGTLTLARWTSTTVVSLSRHISVPGRPAIVTVRVRSGGDVVGGIVRLTSGDTVIGEPIAVGADGRAKTTLPRLWRGVHLIRAEFLGTDAVGGSRSRLTAFVRVF